MREDLIEIDSLIDIVNSLFAGSMSEEFTEIYRRNKIGTIIHDADYYNENNKSSIFGEMLADYSTLMKSEKYEYYKKVLEDIVGIEIVNILENYYNNLTLPNLDRRKV